MKRMLNFGLSLVRIGFKSSKCKTMAKLVIARIKLLRNKREVVVRQMRRDVALLLQSGQDSTARIRVEHVMREQNIMAANEIIELFCELVVARLSIIAKQKACPADLKEGISSLIFAAPRCSDIPELLQIRTIFEKKYGKEFVNASTELRPNCGVNRTLIEKLSVRTPTGEVKLKLMKEIAKEYQIAWDHKETENELLKPSEDLIEGPSTFVSATSMPVKPIQSQGGEWNQPVVKPMPSQGGEWNQSRRLSNDRENPMNYVDTAAAAKGAADSAEKAVAAAQAAAYLANRNTRQIQQTTGFNNSFDGLDNSSSNKYTFGNSSSLSMSNDDAPVNSQVRVHYQDPSGRIHGSNGYDTHSTSLESSEDRLNHSDLHGRTYESQHFERSHVLGNEESKRIHRRHRYNAPSHAPAVHSDINFDESDGPESDGDEEIEMEAPPGRMLPPPNRAPPPLPSSHAYHSDDKPATDNSSSYRRNSLPRVHPKLPDYEELSSRFEALKFRK